jgi:hypothetical protein
VFVEKQTDEASDTGVLYQLYFTGQSSPIALETASPPVDQTAAVKTQTIAPTPLPTDAATVAATEALEEMATPSQVSMATETSLPISPTVQSAPDGQESPQPSNSTTFSLLLAIFVAVLVVVAGVSIKIFRSRRG